MPPKKLKPHQFEAYDFLTRHYDPPTPSDSEGSGRGKVAVLSIPTGSGKTTTAWAVIAKLLTHCKTFDHVVVLSPLTVIRDAWNDVGVIDHRSIGTPTDVDTASLLFDPSGGFERFIRSSNPPRVWTGTHAGGTQSKVPLGRLPKEYRDELPRTLLVIDEAHHLKEGGGDDSGVSTKSSNVLMGQVKKCVEAGASLLCLTATPFRSDGSPILPEKWKGVALYDLSLQEYASYYLNPENRRVGTGNQEILDYVEPLLNGTSGRSDPVISPPCPQKWGVCFHREPKTDIMARESNWWGGDGWGAYLDPSGATDNEKQMLRMAYHWHRKGYPKTIFIVQMGEEVGGTYKHAEYLRDALTRLYHEARLNNALPDWCHRENPHFVVGVGEDGGGELSKAMNEERIIGSTPHPKYEDSTVDGLILFTRGKEGMDWTFCSAVICAMSNTFPSVGVSIQRLGRAMRSKYEMDFSNLGSMSREDINMVRDFASLDYILPLSSDGKNTNHEKKEWDAIAQLAVYLVDSVTAISIMHSASPSKIQGGARVNSSPSKLNPTSKNTDLTKKEVLDAQREISSKGADAFKDGGMPESILAVGITVLEEEGELSAHLTHSAQTITPQPPSTQPQASPNSTSANLVGVKPDLGLQDRWRKEAEILIRDRLETDPAFLQKCLELHTQVAAYMCDIKGAKDISDLARECLSIPLKYHALELDGRKIGKGFILSVVENYERHEGRTTDARNIARWVNEQRQSGATLRLPGTTARMFYFQWWQNMCKYHGRGLSENLPRIAGNYIPSEAEQVERATSEIQRYLDAPP